MGFKWYKANDGCYATDRGTIVLRIFKGICRKNGKTDADCGERTRQLKTFHLSCSVLLLKLVQGLDEEEKHCRIQVVNYIVIPEKLQNMKRGCRRLYKDFDKKQCTDSSQSTKCNLCKEPLDNIIIYNGHPNNSNEEFISLTNETLSIFTGEEDSSFERDSRPVHKLTGYSVYDEQGHLAPFDTGLVEENVVLRLSGYIKPVYSEDPRLNDGIPTHDMGPVNSWYISGFDGGECAYVGVVTSYAEYLLMEPSPDYAFIVSPLLKKIPLLKTIIEFLLDSGSDNPAYEDLLYHLESSANSDFSEEFLLENACFICKQVHSFESAAPEEEPLMDIPCMQTLVELSGVVLGKTKPQAPKKNVYRVFEKKATTTPLVKAVFENFFPQQIKDGKMSKKKRCGICDSCQTPDCGKCLNCKNMIKFGGTGKSKQACELRRCPNMEFKDSDESDGEDHETNPCVKNFAYKHMVNKVEFPEGPVRIEDEKRFYSAAVVGNVTVTKGDFVMLHPEKPNKPLIIGKVISIFSKHNQPTFHTQMYCRGTDTVLGETADPQELFVADVCEDCPLQNIVGKAQVTFKKVNKDWAILGGIETLEAPLKDGDRFFFSKRYDGETARFTDHLDEVLPPDQCPCCRKRSELKKFESRFMDGNCVRWRGESYEIGSSVFLNPCVYTFQAKGVDYVEPTTTVDDEMYPEYHRKIPDSNTAQDITEPFRIGQIEDIVCSVKDSAIKIKVRLFFRPENTKNSVFLAHEKDLNLVYWTEEVITTSFDKVTGKCYVTYCDPSDAAQWSEKGPFRFYFTEGYNPKTYEYFDVPRHALKFSYFGKSKKVKPFGQFVDNDDETPPEWEKVERPLKCMDIFAGCGGLSLGLHQSGVAETKWAIENATKPAEAFKINNPACKVYTADCNKILKEIIDESDDKLPKKGDVEILVGGPPCQGFSNMNQFSSKQYSLLKNSLITTMLSFCDYYRPKYFVLENVRNFGQFKRAMVLKLTVRCLLAMHYQVAFGVLQAAHYGLPQTRRRFILVAAAPGVILPKFPAPLHVFEKKDYHLSLTVDGARYYRDSVWEESAPYRAICVRDAISDLPSIPSGHNKEKIAYDEEAISHFQRQLRGNDTILYDHICKEMAPIVEARILYIPCVPGSDWRDLPNICVRLRDNTVTKVLQYPYYSRKQKKFDKPRAVCQCATGKSCNPDDRQINTLIPWCLPHTADRHNNWAGLYGRLGWDEVFRTTINNPEPIGKQGKVIHPEQNRVVSVRECARSQGFPDQYRFVGGILDKHKQIGNAVPPPLGKAIGLEIKKAVALAQNKD